jgi:hypothetical protein
MSSDETSGCEAILGLAMADAMTPMNFAGPWWEATGSVSVAAPQRPLKIISTPPDRPREDLVSLREGLGMAGRASRDDQTIDQKKDHGHRRGADRPDDDYSVLSMVWVIEVGDRLQELTNSYIPAYGHLARTNIRSMERALALRRMIIEKMQSPTGNDKSATIRKVFDAKEAEVEREAQAARALIHDLIEKGATFGDANALVRLETRIDSAMADTRRGLNVEIEPLLAALDTRDAKATADSLQRVDALRDDLNQKLDS